MTNTHTPSRSRHEATRLRRAKAPEAALCCPVEYNKNLLKIIPQEVIENDYGCGDPSRYVKPGETVSISAAARGKSVSSPRKSSARRAASLAWT